MGLMPKSRWHDLPAYALVRLAFGSITVAHPGSAIRAMGGLGRLWGASSANRSRLKRAEDNLAIAFPHWDADERRQCAVASYRHLMRLAGEVAFLPRLLTEDAWPAHISVGSISPAVRALLSGQPCVLITGHCGNWEVLGYTVALLGFPMHALYRPLDSKPLDAWLRRTRAARGLTLVDKFGAVHRLPGLVAGGAPAGFVADQNGGDRGMFVPFFGRLTSTYKSVGLLAMQFGARVVVGMARRRGPWELSTRQRDAAMGLSYEIVVGDSFGPEEYLSAEDPLFYLTARYRRGIEGLVRSAPDQYLWMHRIWRSRPRHERESAKFPGRLEARLRCLPWMTDEEVERLKDRSARDAKLLAATGTSRLS